MTEIIGKVEFDSLKYLNVCLHNDISFVLCADEVCYVKDVCKRDDACSHFYVEFWNDNVCVGYIEAIDISNVFYRDVDLKHLVFEGGTLYG